MLPVYTTSLNREGSVVTRVSTTLQEELGDLTGLMIILVVEWEDKSFCREEMAEPALET